jgi:transcription elongation factor Elf1
MDTYKFEWTCRACGATNIWRVNVDSGQTVDDPVFLSCGLCGGETIAVVMPPNNQSENTEKQKG